MGYNVMQMGSAALQMFGDNGSGASLKEFGESSGKLGAFQEKFAAVFQDNGFDKGKVSSGTDILEKIADAVSAELENVEGKDFIEKLENFLRTISGENFQNLSMGQEGLNAVKQLLAGAGYSMEEVDALLEKLQMKEGGEGEMISVSELLDGLSELETTNGNQDEEGEFGYMLASSSLPFIDSILTSLGIPRDIKDSILAAAKKDDKIDLDSLIQELQQLQKQAFFSNQSFSASAEDGNIGKLFEQLNLNGQSDGKNFSLTDFIQALEARLNDLRTASNATENQAGSQTSQDAMSKNSRLQDLMDLLSAKENMKEDHVSMPNGKKAARSSDLMATLVKNLRLKSDGGGNGKGAGTEYAAAIGQGKSGDPNFSIMDLSKKQLHELLFSGQNNQNPSSDAGKIGIDQKISSMLEKIESGISGKNGSEGLKTGDSDGKTGLLKDGPSGGSRISNALAATGSSDFKSAESPKYMTSLQEKPAVKNLPNYVTNQIGKGLFKAVNSGESELKLQLKPPELGRIVMRIDDAGGGMRVNVMAENHSARDILISHAHDLKATLANSGISLESFDVQMGKDFGQSMADARGQSGQSGKKGKNSESGHEEGEDHGKDPEMDEGYSETTGSLHYVA